MVNFLSDSATLEDAHVHLEVVAVVYGHVKAHARAEAEVEVGHSEETGKEVVVEAGVHAVMADLGHAAETEPVLVLELVEAEAEEEQNDEVVPKKAVVARNTSRSTAVLSVGQMEVAGVSTVAELEAAEGLAVEDMWRIHSLMSLQVMVEKESARHEWVGVKVVVEAGMKVLRGVGRSKADREGAIIKIGLR